MIHLMKMTDLFKIYDLYETLCHEEYKIPLHCL